ncbi:MAG: peptidase domain-containing ABC transporter [Alphaproteobacteria bacterium]|nr:peptidase domain-containing ABC transporter [Alphaproteobacteria bacterium]
MQAMRGSQKSLILVARQLGIHIGPNDIPDRFKNDERELSPKEMCELAHSFNLKAKSTKITDNELIKLLTKKQQILRLQNGRYVIALRIIDSKDDDKSILFLDTGVTTPKPQQISIKELKKGWDGQVILLKARLKAFEEQSELKLSWLIGESLRNKSVMVQVVICALILNIFAVVPAVFMMLVLDKVVNYEAYSTLYVITSGVIVAYLFNGILGFLRAYLLDFLSQKVEAKLSVRVFEKLISLPMQRFHRESANFLRFTSQISVIKNTLTQKIFSTALDSISLLVFVPILFFYSPVLFMVVFSFSILGAIASIIYSKRQRDSMGKVGKAEAKRQEFISVSVNGIENVKGLALEPTLKEQWRELEANFIIASEDMQKKSATLNNISSTINQLMTAMVIFVGVHLVFSGSLSAGILVGFNMLATRVSKPIVDLVTLKTEINKLVQSLQLVSGIVDANTETSVKGQKPQLMGQISFRNVEFGYDDNTKILKDVDIEINPRQVIGLTGKSGCGKSTIAKLIQGLYRPQSGIVALDNVDLRLLDLSHIRSQVSLVGSESYFFPGTIRESISRAAPNSSMDKITWAAKKVYAHDEIESFPDGYETFLEENATNLSTGLRQKLAIARALIRNPRVIILDDAITGFDVDSEIKLYDALSDIALGRTVIIVSNRLWHLRICNKIFVLDKGVITQQGSFEELKNVKGFFGETFNKQISVLGFNNPTKKVV